MDISYSAKVNNGMLYIITPDEVHMVPVSSIKSLKRSGNKVYLAHEDTILALPEDCYHFIALALANAPETTRHYKLELGGNFLHYTREV